MTSPLFYGDKVAKGTWVMGELEKNEYSDDRNEEGLNGPFNLEEEKNQSPQ